MTMTATALPDRQVRIQALREAAAAASQAEPTNDLLSIASAVRRFAAEHPDLYDATIPSTHGADPELQAAGQAYLGIFVAALQSRGLQSDEIIHGVRSVLAAIHGFVMLGRGGAFGMPIGVDASFEWLIGHLSAALDAS
jgi:hypothetical protein